MSFTLLEIMPTGVHVVTYDRLDKAVEGYLNRFPVISNAIAEIHSGKVCYIPSHIQRHYRLTLYSPTWLILLSTKTY